MDWKREAIDKLSEYAARAASIPNLKRQIADMESDLMSIKSARYDGTAVRGSGSSQRDDRMINLIAGIGERKKALRSVTDWVEAVDMATAQLSEEDYHVLDILYIHRQKGAINRLREELCLAEESSVYRRRDKALRSFTLLLYGNLET